MSYLIIINCDVHQIILESVIVGNTLKVSIDTYFIGSYNVNVFIIVLNDIYIIIDI